MNKTPVLFGIFILTLLSLSVGSAYAHPHSGQIHVDDHTHETQTEIIPLNGLMGLEKSTIFFDTPKENSLPWGFVEGKIANHVEGYPVIIQIFQDDQAVHFAQTNVEKNGGYEYKFRVLNSDDGDIDEIFDGTYSVKIFKVVYLYHENLI